ncbi:MAG: repair protein RecN [Actinomycetota bacterium]|jgi:DNA repair protein RecN (Recombination protein N)
MLVELHIEDLGVIDRLDLVLGAGLVAVTGETGAGKTMIVEAVNLLVGGRADAARVRAGATEARVEGRFVIGDDEWVLARVVPVDGRSRAYVNGRLATVGQLVEIGERLVDVHGQHAHQSLLTTSVQRAALDEFAGVDLESLRSARARLTEIDASLAALGGDERLRARDIELLRYQIDEIDGVGIVSLDEEDDVARIEDTLADAAAHREAAHETVSNLSDDEGVLDRLGALIARLSARRPFDEVVARLRAVVAELDDVAREARSIAESCEDDPERLAAARVRRQALRDLRRKYGETLADVLSYVEECRTRVAELESHGDRVAELEAERREVLVAERAAAAVVANARRAAASKLGKAISRHLPSLAMPKATVTVIVDGEDPADEVSFLLAANPGLPAVPLAKAASGGELARAMLAMRLVLSSGPPILVFDEVDAGIGGQAATHVASALSDLATRCQILVVTHLAQVAARADHHVVVDKEFVTTTGRDGKKGAESTVARARVVDGPIRVAEIARMLSGDAESTAARRHAKELLSGKSRQA